MKLLYSELTEKVYIVKKKTKIDITPEFVNIVLLWLHGADQKMEVGEKFARDVAVAGSVEFEITITRTK